MRQEKDRRVCESENPAVPAPTPAPNRPRTNRDWWPNQLDLSVLHQHSAKSNPMGDDFDYAKEFATLDVEALKRDVFEVMTTSQDWWPADYGHYGPLFIRMSWHAAGTYRIADGRGGGGSGAQRFAPLNSWPDNVSLDKARRLLWPIKQKYGRKISWADLLVFAGNCAYESMGLTTFGFGFGREDIWEPEEIFWGPEDTWLGDERYSGDRELSGPLGAVQMGLIYVNPEGPNGNPDPLAAARDIRETFGRMAMNDEETVALIVGGHTVGKSHGAAPASTSARSPRARRWRTRAWAGRTATAAARAATRSPAGSRAPGPTKPTTWDNGYLDNLFRYDWELTTSPAGAQQWTPKNPEAQGTVPDAHDPSKRHTPMMLTTDLALRLDPIYEPIAKRFHENPDELADAFAKAWYKLLHRDMGPLSRYLGPWVAEPQLWQDPVPAVDHELVDDEDVATLKAAHPRLGAVRLAAGLHRLGVGGELPRHRQARRGQRGADPPRAAEGLGGQRAGRAGGCCRPSSGSSRTFNDGADRRQEGLARRPDRPGRLRRRREGGEGRRARRHGPVRAGPHRRLAGADRRRVVRRARAEGRRVPQLPADRARSCSPETLLLDRAYMLNLTAPEMTVLVGGLRALDANVGQAQHGVFTDRPGTLTNDFFVNLLDMGTEWKASESAENVYDGRDRATGEVTWTATAVDLVFGSNSAAPRPRGGLRDRRRARRSSCATSWRPGTRS